MPLSELQDPKKLSGLVEQFAAMYDLDYGPSSGAASSLAVDSGNTATTASPASSILSDVISANGQTLSASLNAFTNTSTAAFSTELMSSLQMLSLGG